MPGNRGEAETSPLVSFFGFALTVTAFDQLTKWCVLSFLSEGDSIPLLQGIFHLTLVHNTGIAFGFFNRHPSILLVLITASLFVLIWLGWNISKNTHDDKIMESSRLSRMGLALILGGALGNWIDRIRFQAVIDFLDFRVWPVFNLADSAITIGVCLYLFLLVRRRNPAHKKIE